MFDFNKNKGFIIALAGALVLLIVFLALWRIEAGACEESLLGHQDTCDRYQSLVDKYQGEPGKALVDLYKAKLESIKRGKEAMKTAFVPPPLPKYTPASFKGTLKDASDEFYDKCLDKGIRVDKNIGFAEFISGDELPKQSELATLTRQFSIIKDVLNTLIANGVDEITVIDRNPAGEDEVDEEWDDEEVDFGDDEGPSGREEKKKVSAKKELYTAVPVLFQFRTSPGKLNKILAGIRNANQFYRIKNIDARTSIQTEGESSDPSDIKETLSVSFIVENIKI